MRVVLSSVKDTSDELPSDFAFPSQPSASLVEALLAIIASAQRLGVSRIQLSQRKPVQDALESFVNKVSQRITVTGTWSPSQAQILWDLEFLGRFREATGEDDDDTPRAEIQRRIASNIPKPARGRWATHLDTSLQQQLGRLQILLAPLMSLSSWDRLAPSASARTPLLRVGAPTAVPEAHGDVAQSHVPRFTLLAS